MAKSLFHLLMEINQALVANFECHKYVLTLFWEIKLLRKFLNFTASEWVEVYRMIAEFRILRLTFLKMFGAQWLSGRVLDSRPRGCGFEPHHCHYCVLVQDIIILLSSGSTQEDPSRHNWDIKKQIKPTDTSI